MLRVGVAGAAGRMGRHVCEAVAADDDMLLVAAVDPAAAGASLEELIGQGCPPVSVTSDLEGMAAAGVQVAVDFTDAAGAKENLAWFAKNGVHAVVGSTGLSEEDLAEAERLFAASSANAVIAPNFAIGAVLLVHFCELAAPVMEGVEIIELHHDAKRDAPSGTALDTAERIAAAREAAGAGDLPPDPTTHQLLPGSRGGEGPAGIRVHSVRLPGLVAHEEVVFGSLGQSLSIRHDSYDRRSFMPGVLLAVRSVPTRPGLTLGLGPLLGF